MDKTKLKIAAVLSGLFVLIVIILISGKNAEIHTRLTDLDKIRATGRLRVVTEKSRTGFFQGENTVEGFSYEIVKAFADSLGLELEINLVNNMDSAITGILKNKYDLIANNLPNTADLNNQLNLSVPILTSRQMLIQRVVNDSSGTDSLITDHHRLAKKKIHIPQGSPFKMRLENLSREIADTIFIVGLESLSTEGLVRAVSEGKIDYTICDEMQARRLSREYANIDFSLPVGFNQQFCWAVNKESSNLLVAVDQFLSDFMLSNNYWSILRKYY